MNLFDWERRGLLTGEQTEALTSDLHPAFIAIWQGALEQFMSIPSGPRGRLEQFSIIKSGNLNAFARSIASEVLVDSETIQHCRKLGFWKWYIKNQFTGNAALIRFKLLRPTLLVSPSKTKQSRLYYNNAPIRGLDNSATRVNVGCTLGIEGIDAIYLTCQRGEDLIFKVRLDSPKMLPVPVPTTENTEPAIIPPQIVPRKAK